MILDVDDGAEVVLPPSVLAPRAARHVVRRALERHGVPPDDVDVAVLLASELVANSALHARTLLSVAATVHDRTVRLEVADCSDRVPRPGEPGEGAERGRGLLLVDGLADGWGTDAYPGDGKTIWAELHHGCAGVPGLPRA